MKGQSLIESVLALGVIAIVLSSIATTLISSLNNASRGRDQALATQYAQEGIEILRKIRNRNYLAFRGYNGTYCLSVNATNLGSPSSCTSPNVGSYIRSVDLEQSPGCGTNIAKATVKVSWTDGKCSTGSYCHTSELISCLSTVSPVREP